MYEHCTSQLLLCNTIFLVTKLMRIISACQSNYFVDPEDIQHGAAGNAGQAGSRAQVHILCQPWTSGFYPWGTSLPSLALVYPVNTCISALTVMNRTQMFLQCVVVFGLACPYVLTLCAVRVCTAHKHPPQQALTSQV